MVGPEVVFVFDVHACVRVFVYVFPCVFALSKLRLRNTRREAATLLWHHDLFI